MLYLDKDNLNSLYTIQNFTRTNNATLTIMQGGEHWIHTDKQMEFLYN